jgi:hypothetical protein
MFLDFARDCPHLGCNRARAPFQKLRIQPQRIQPARRGRLPILESKRQNLRRPRQGFVVGGGDDAGEIGEGDAEAGGGFVDEGDVGLCAQGSGLLRFVMLGFVPGTQTLCSRFCGDFQLGRRELGPRDECEDDGGWVCRRSIVNIEAWIPGSASRPRNDESVDGFLADSVVGDCRSRPSHRHSGAAQRNPGPMPRWRGADLSDTTVPIRVNHANYGYRH